ncbi:hypothetical protein KSP40_PGU012879 [Platanthera guangdongensis]|uniref:Uncharacterized protein n=1 Tax=Platanthera guangdongensis TaxID=2320717 RepID=A0ABR2N3P8_9ASPA
MLKLLIFLKLEALSACQRIFWIHLHRLKLFQKISWIALGKRWSVLFPCRSCFFVVICFDHVFLYKFISLDVSCLVHRRI